MNIGDTKQLWQVEPIVLPRPIEVGQQPPVEATAPPIRPAPAASPDVVR
jgi:hypothetical protein